jgi:plasmid maintenance system killer protein
MSSSRCESLNLWVIRSFKDKRAEAIFRGEFVKGLDGKIQQRAREKLKYLDAAASNSR